MHDVFELDAHRDLLRLQELLQRCSDYYELHEGWPTPEDAALHELTVVPPQSSAGDLRLLAIGVGEGRLGAVAQLLRDYPEGGTWWIGMLLVAPELRGRGVGATLLRRALEEASAEGASALRLVVSVKNPRAQRFWEREGFVDTGEVRSVTARSGHVATVRILSRALRR